MSLWPLLQSPTSLIVSNNSHCVNMERRGAPVWLDTSTRNTTYTVYHNGTWVGMTALSVFLLLTCALLAGLTLALCSLNLTWLEIISATGDMKRRKQAIMVAKLRRQSSWMLCSLIISSVACGESLPFLIQSICHSEQAWVPIVLSTLLIAIFAEILPQYLIPRSALAWGYHCRPIVWVCMWITCILSFPLARLLDHLSGNPDEPGIFTNSELAVLLKHHERREKHGGQLCQDTSRVMIGALKLGTCRLSGVATSTYKNDLDGKDLEKAESILVRGLMITNWSAVKTIHVNEPVDKAFIRKVMSWSYSRIPVIGKSDDQDKDASKSRQWPTIKIFGFLHIKNLIGLNIKDNHNLETGLLVKDLSLYPLPIVRQDMAAYDLLNMFQLGISRMALVVRPRELLGTLGGRDDWTADFLEAARRSFQPSIPQRERIFGIRSPEPLGIITYEDIIERILQKGGHDEKDFFDRGLIETHMESKMAHNYNDVSSKEDPNMIPAKASVCIPADVQRAQASIGESFLTGSLRRHHVSQGKGKGREDDPEKAVGGLDGADDRSIVLDRTRKYTEGSYTENSQGGLHHADSSASSSGNSLVLTPEHLAEIGAYPFPFPRGTDSSLSLLKTASQSSCQTPMFLSGSTPVPRHFSVGVPRLPRLRRVTPFSRQNYSSFERASSQQDEINLITSSHLVHHVFNEFNNRLQLDRSNVDAKGTSERSFPENHSPEMSGDAISLASWYHSGFPSQLDITDCSETTDPSSNAEFGSKQTFIPSLSKTLPHMHGITTSINSLSEGFGGETPLREKSFHDDRAILSSQRHGQRRSMMNSAQTGGARSTSLWF